MKILITYLEPVVDSTKPNVLYKTAVLRPGQSGGTTRGDV